MECKLTPIASSVMELCGPEPFDLLHEMECPSDLMARVFRFRLMAFNREQNMALFSKGLDISPYFVNKYPGYAGTYLN